VKVKESERHEKNVEISRTRFFDGGTIHSLPSTIQAACNPLQSYFGHWKTGQPEGLALVHHDEVVPGEGDEGILRAALVERIGGEDNWLVGHLPQHSANNLVGQGNADAKGLVLVQGGWDGVVVGVASDVHNTSVGELQLVGNNDGHKVPPDAAIAVISRQPLLAGHVQNVAGVAGALEGHILRSNESLKSCQLESGDKMDTTTACFVKTNWRRANQSTKSTNRGDQRYCE
jgi:hypothetical protein